MRASLLLLLLVDVSGLHLPSNYPQLRVCRKIIDNLNKNVFKQRSKRQEVSASADVEPPVEPEIEPVASETADPLPVEDIDEDTAAEIEVEEESIDETETNEEEVISEEPSDDISPVANVTDITQEGEKGMWLKLIKIRHLMAMIHLLE